MIGHLKRGPSNWFEGLKACADRGAELALIDSDKKLTEVSKVAFDLYSQMNSESNYSSLFSFVELSFTSHNLFVKTGKENKAKIVKEGNNVFANFPTFNCSSSNVQYIYDCFMINLKLGIKYTNIFGIKCDEGIEDANIICESKLTSNIHTAKDLNCFENNEKFRNNKYLFHVCNSSIQRKWTDSYKFCLLKKMKLLYFENEDVSEFIWLGNRTRSFINNLGLSSNSFSLALGKIGNLKQIFDTQNQTDGLMKFHQNETVNPCEREISLEKQAGSSEPLKSYNLSLHLQIFLFLIFYFRFRMSASDYGFNSNKY